MQNPHCLNLLAGQFRKLRHARTGGLPIDDDGTRTASTFFAAILDGSDAQFLPQEIH
jgi:hypothetical protein